MLELKNIVKDYITSTFTTHALKGVSLNFRRNEFVSILGPSGCGKTTLLNIIGGLDRYTEGDLIIEGKSTKEYKDRDWDTYRNHSIGFVFQNYNLIMHQNILSNVEIALTISGVSKKERKERAKKVLERVGLGEYILKMPNQLSGGQMQRVAIARALVNNPEILLADEPTGALDSETSVQIMELLKEIASDRLVIMVTHNPDLANTYSTRIINLNDGLITGDTNPFNNEDAKKDVKPIESKTKGNKKQASMSFLTALGLSFRNLLNKKGRTILVSFAGSIGITGIALILGLSDGFHNYVNQIQTDTLSKYPLTISTTETDLTQTLDTIMNSSASETEEFPDGEKVSEASVLTSVIKNVASSSYQNNLTSLKTYLDDPEMVKKYGKYYNAIQYVYDTDIQTFSLKSSSNLYTRDYPVSYNILGDSSALISFLQDYDEIIDNEGLIADQYDLLAGEYPSEAYDMVIVLDKYNRINDYVLYSLGLRNLQNDVARIASNKELVPWEGTFTDLLNLKYKSVTSAEVFSEDSENPGKYKALSGTALQEKIETLPDMRVCGVVRPKASATTTSINGGVGYTAKLVQAVMDRINASPSIIAQKASPNTNVFIGLSGVSSDEITTDEYKKILSSFGVCDEAIPYRIKIYPTSFDGKTKIKEMINEYNNTRENESDKIKYTDSVGSIISSVSIIVNSVTYVLIAFVSISLIVSSIMIGIITYVSVIERTKEIGVLRSLGASKRDVGNVFNAETLMIGFSAGLVGVVVTLILIIPINIIIGVLTNIYGLAVLMWYWWLALIAISMILTSVAGLIPSMLAAKKDPVVALRTGE